jgi:hypothetical protein
MNLDSYYEAICDYKGEHFSEKDFSKEYLGRCITYYAYLKSSNSKPSKSALINLWKQLKLDTYKCDEYAQRSKVEWLTESYKQHKQTLDGLCASLIQDIMYDATTNLQQHKLAS